MSLILLSKTPLQSPPSSSSTNSSSSPPSLPLLGNSISSCLDRNYPISLCISKYECVICSDQASGKHYGVYSCEGCKGFFKRTVRKELLYTCRLNQACVIDRRQRNRCQYCRFKKCMLMGMQKEGVQDEKKKLTKRLNDFKMLRHESFGDFCDSDEKFSIFVFIDEKMFDEDVKFQCNSTEYYQLAVMEIENIIKWASRLPHFSQLHTNDKRTLIKENWIEVFLFSLVSSKCLGSSSFIDIFSQISGKIKSGIHASEYNVLYEMWHRISVELVKRFSDLCIDFIEVGIMKMFILLDIVGKKLVEPEEIEKLRDEVLQLLDMYIEKTYPHNTFKLYNFVIRLASLRSISLCCLKSSFFTILILRWFISNLYTAMVNLQPLDVDCQSIVNDLVEEFDFG